MFKLSEKHVLKIVNYQKLLIEILKLVTVAMKTWKKIMNKHEKYITITVLLQETLEWKKLKISIEP